MTPDQVSVFIPLEEPLKRAANHENLVETRQIQLAVRESPVNLLEDLTAAAVAEHSRDKIFPVFKFEFAWDQFFRLCNLKVTFVSNETDVGETEAHGAHPNDAVIARFTFCESVAVAQLPYFSKRRELAMIGAIFGAFEVFIPKIELKKIPREGLYKDVALGPKQMHIHLLGDSNFAPKSLLIAESAWWFVLFSKHKKAVRHFHQAIYIEIAHQEMLDALLWNSNPGFAIAK